MTVTDRTGGDLPRGRVTVELDDIQATVLRYRPEPYYGTHVMLHVDDARAGRELLRELAPRIDSAADWWHAREPWIAAALTYSGLAALGVPEDSLQSFPEAFRVGMAARAHELHDYGANDPQHWDREFGTGAIHVAVSVFSDSEEKWRRTMDTARRHYEGRPGLRVLTAQDFGAQPGDLNPLGYRDSIGQPAIEGSGIEPLPGQGMAIKAGEFILGYPGEAGVPLPAPRPEVLGRNGTYVGLRKYQSRVGAFNRFLHANAQTHDERELLAAKLVGRWRSGAPLTLAPDRDDPALGADPLRNNDFTYAADQHGRQVPRGSHMRRMNPRDTKMSVLVDVNIHRIIRRSTTFGAPYDPDALSQQDDETPRGLYFVFLSAKAMATMEFLQQEWINNGNFMSLGDERDPNVGLQQDGAIFTIPHAPVRRRIHGLETFNVLRGGEYFFLPSLTALRWLGEEH
ncbi:Dyp-type peroxidase [Amycolatopsis sp. CA-161197]|uniref:Dyp-type peroxidase n=1 Tax=Amycolatopsis sp. CA-161197 TaxID=3239922 RepID=UPI003D902AFD